MKERITDRIGLKDTYYGGKTGTKNNERYSYTYTNAWTPATKTDMSIPGGAGAIVSTPPDLVQFINSLFTGKLISTKSLDQMKMVSAGRNYGMGMLPYQFGEKKGYGHNGGIDGFLSSLAYFPGDSLSVCYCTNGAVSDINDIMPGAVSIYFNEAYNIPSFKSLILKPEDLSKYPGIYSSKVLPLKVTITQDSATLIAQATGQPSFPLTAINHDKFAYDAEGVDLDFDPAKNEITLLQKGHTIVFTKEK